MSSSRKRMKMLLVGVVVIALCSAQSFAVIGQIGGWGLNANNTATRFGAGTSNAGNVGMYNFGQNSYDFTSQTGAAQRSSGLVNQGATVSGGRRGSGFVVQNVSAGTTKSQLAAPGVAIQSTSTGAILTSAVGNEGVGGASGVNSFVGTETQTIVSPTGISTQGSIIAGVQFNAVSGAPGHNLQLSASSLDISADQGQINVADCPPEPCPRPSTPEPCEQPPTPNEPCPMPNGPCPK